MYLLTGLGVTVGFHRLLTHRAFKTSSAGCAASLAILGSAAIEGPVISWVADHRKHHAFSDQEGDPHSPHVDHGGGWRGALRGLFHAHVGWLFIHTQRGAQDALRAGPDRRTRSSASSTAPSCSGRSAGWSRAFVLGWLIGGTLATRPAPACCGAAPCGCSCCTT